MGDVFVNAEKGNLHVKEGSKASVGQGVPFREVTHDIDGQRRLGRPNIGADEWIAN